MKYFKYALQLNPVLMMQIHEIVYRYKPLAISKYKSNWEEALNDAYFHVIENYDESKGALESYICSVISTINLNKFSSSNKEVCSDIVYDLESNRYSIEIYNSVLLAEYDTEYSEDDTEYSEDVNSCVQYLLPYFIQDYDFFATKDASNRKLRYNELKLFDRFSSSVIVKAMDELCFYYDEAKYLKELSKSCHVRNFNGDRYLSSIDKTLSYIVRIGDTVKCKTVRSGRQKYPYLLDISDVLGKLYNMFYSRKGIGSRIICDRLVYCSLSGRILFSKEELYDALEREIIGTILAMRHNLQVLHYNKSSEIILTSSSILEPHVVMPMFGVGVYIPLTRLILGKLKK